MIIDNEEYDLTEYYNFKNYRYNRLNLKLKGINNVTDMNNMFDGCSSLLSLPDISKLNTNNVIKMEGLFNKCSSLT